MPAPTRRTGAKITDIPPQRLACLNAGTVEASNMTEGLAIDFAALMRAAVPEADEAAARTMESHAGDGVTKRMALAGTLLLDALGEAAIAKIGSHTSDTVRGWACSMIAGIDGLSLAQRLDAIRPLADDPHYGVREWAWMALRPHLAAELNTAMDILSGWTAEPSERLRRFASEATRPRGVWCRHIASLRESPALGLPILAPLRADPSRYVQNSVGNWLNDAAKDHPDWVRELCASWTGENPGPETAWICKRALRSLIKRQ
jgi:3-methyladenine DNA glycosylase AlkC